jgi:hypothetical protein
MIPPHSPPFLKSPNPQKSILETNKDKLETPHVLNRPGYDAHPLNAFQEGTTTYAIVDS